jgi:hypothetical protein
MRGTDETARPAARSLRVDGSVRTQVISGRPEMSAIPTTRRLIEAYAESEPWKLHHDQAMACRDIEEAMRWGVRLFRGLSEQEAALQARAIASRGHGPDLDMSEYEELFRQLVEMSEMILRGAAKLSEEGFKVEGLDEFRRVAEEARCQVELWGFESELLPIEEARLRLRPENPRPERYES